MVAWRHLGLEAGQRHGDKAVLDYALLPEHVKNVCVGIVNQTPSMLPLAAACQTTRCHRGIDVDAARHGHGAGGSRQARGRFAAALHTVVHSEEFDVAIAYLIRPLEEGASHENFMSAVFELNEDEALFEREKNRFMAALDHLEAITGDGSVESFQVPKPNRLQSRGHYDADGAEAGSSSGWRPDAAASSRTRRQRSRSVRQPGLGESDRKPGWSSRGSGQRWVASNRIADPETLDEVIARGVNAADGWQQLGAHERARILYRAAERLEAKRALLAGGDGLGVRKDH